MFTELIVRGGIIHRIAGQRVGESVVSTLTPSGMQLVWTKLHDQALEPGILNLIERVRVDDWCEGPVVGDKLEQCTGEGRENISSPPRRQLGAPVR